MRRPAQKIGAFMCVECKKFISMADIVEGKTMYRFNYETERDEHLCPRCTTKMEKSDA